MAKSLLLFDTDHIKRYVFATDKLREIRAASAILDQLNRQEMVNIATQQGEKVYANGGSGLFVVDTDRVDEISTQVKATYRKKTTLASVTGVAVNGLEAVDWAKTDISPERELLGYKLQMAKDDPQEIVPLFTHSFLNYCRSCGKAYAGQTVIENNQPKLVCPSCGEKVWYDKEIKAKIDDDVGSVTDDTPSKENESLWARLIRRLKKRGYQLTGNTRPETFDELADLSHPKGYLALIYADGDAMGQQLQQIRTLEQMQGFADAVDNSIYDAATEAIDKHLKPKKESETWPFDILLLGGDDLIMATRAESALEVALTVLKTFNQLATERYTTKYPHTKPLHVSVAVTIAHANYPFGELRHLTESALKFAKKAAAKRRQQDDRFHEGMLNFLVVSSANHLDFNQFYKDQLHVKAEYNSPTPNLYRSLRPYAAAEFEELLKAVRLLKDLNTPRTKLEQLRSLLFQTKQQSMVDALSLLFHWRNDHQQRTIQKIVADFSPERAEVGLQFPWFQTAVENDNQKIEYFTPLLDLIEIYDFISPEEQTDDNRH